MAIEAMRKKVCCMMNDFMVLECGTIDRFCIWLCLGVAVLIVDVIVVFAVESDFSRTSGEERPFYIHELAEQEILHALSFRGGYQFSI